MTVILNGKASNTKPEEVIAVNGKRAIELPPVINGFAPTDITINGYDHTPLLPSCVLYLPLWHSKLSRPSPIYSIDKYRRLCSVYGALWRPDGRYFDGVNDRIASSDINFPASNAPRTIVFWTKNLEPTGVTDGAFFWRYGTVDQRKWCASYIAGGTTDVYFSGAADDFDTGINLDDDNWHQLIYTYDGTNARAYKDLVEGSGSPDPRAWTTVLSGTFTIGSNGVGEYLNIVMGEFQFITKC